MEDFRPGPLICTTLLDIIMDGSRLVFLASHIQMNAPIIQI